MFIIRNDVIDILSAHALIDCVVSPFTQISPQLDLVQLYNASHQDPAAGDKIM